MTQFRTLLGPMRVPFLLLTPACMAVGFATAIREQGRIDWLDGVLVLVGGLAAHISVNAFNEHHDFRSGLDFRTARTPFSGGSGTLPAHPELAPAALATALASLVVTTLVGLYFVWRRGWELLPLGAVGLLLLPGYTAWITRRPVLCLLAPGLGFGTLMVLGTHYALTGSWSWTALLASFVPLFLVSDLLLLNQFPDVEADRGAGRCHLPIVLGRRRSARIYTAFLLAAYGTLLAGVAAGSFPATALLGLATAALALPVIRRVLRDADDIPALLPALRNNVLINLLTPTLLAAGLVVGS